MCMLIKKTECLKEGIYVYVVRYIYLNKIRSPFRTHTIWKMKKTYTVEEGNVKIKRRFQNKMIESGVFHCFYSEINANRLIDAISKDNRCGGTYTVHRAWIPAGTYIAEGAIGDGYMGSGMKCLGTRKLMLSKQLIERKIESNIEYTFSWEKRATFGKTTTSASTNTGYVYNTGSTT